MCSNIKKKLTIYAFNDQIGNLGEGHFMLFSRINKLFCKYNGFPGGMVEKGYINNVNISLAKSIRIPYMKKLQPYIFWIHVARCI